MANQAEVAATFPAMQEKFDPSKAQGMDATIQFDLTGEGGGQYWIRIAGQTLTTGEGPATSPAMTVRGSADDFLAVVNGTLNPMQAFMLGKIKVAGDTNLALKLMPLLS